MGNIDDKMSLLYGTDSVGEGQTLGIDPVTKIRQEYGVGQPAAFLTTSQQEALDESLTAEKDSISLGDTISAAWDVTGTLPAIARSVERQKIPDDFDPNFKIGKELGEQLVQDYNKTELDYIYGSLSPTEVKTRQYDVQEDRDSNRKLALSGTSGLVATVALGVFDPVQIALTMATGPIGLAANASRLARAVSYGVKSAAEGAIIESILVQSDTQKDVSDVVTAGIMSGALGMSVGFAFPHRMPEEIRDTLHSSDETQRSVARGQQDQQMRDAYDNYLNEAQYNQKLSEYEAGAADRPSKDIDRHEFQLKQEASESRVYEKTLRRAIKEKETLEKDLVMYSKEKEEDLLFIEKALPHKKGKGRGRKKARRANKRAKQDAETRQTTKGLATQGKIDDINRMLEKDADIVKAKGRLEEWNKLSNKEKHYQLFPDTTPEQLKIREEAKAFEILDEKEWRATQWKSNQPTPEVTEEGGVSPTKEDDGSDLYNTGPEKGSYSLLDATVEATARREKSQGSNWLNKKWIPEIFKGDYTRLDKSDHLVIRAVRDLFMENGEGMSGSNVATYNYSMLQDVKRAGRDAYNRGLSLYIEEHGMSQAKGLMSNKLHAQYHKELVQAIKNGVNPRTPKSIQIAREGASAQFAAGLQVAKEGGVKGFENVSENANYFPDIIHGTKMQAVATDAGFGSSDMIDLLAKGYRSGDNELSVAQARVVASIKYQNVMRGNIKLSQDAQAIFRSDSVADATNLLQEAHVDQLTIDAFVKEVSDKGDWKRVSNRARRSLRIDWTASHTVGGNTVKISDVMEDNVGKILESYSRELSFAGAMGLKGIKSEGELSRFLTLARKSVNNTISKGRGKGNTKAQFKEASDHFDLIEGVIQQMKGKSLIDYNRAGNRLGRSIRGVTSLLALQQVGFSSIAEISKTLTQVGVIQTLQSVKEAGVFRLPQAFVKRGIGKNIRDKEWKLIHQNMRESEELFGFTGEQEMGNNFTVRDEDMGSEMDTDLAKMFDNALEQGKRVGTWLSGHQFIQGGVAKINALAIQRKLLRHALGKETLGTSLTNQMKIAGLHGRKWEEISQWIKDNPATYEQDGSHFDSWNLNNMPVTMRRELKVGMNKIQGRNIQRGYHGEVNSMWMGSVGKFLTEFRSFSLNSLSKQLVGDLRHDPQGFAVNFMWNTGLAYAAYMAQVNIAAMITGGAEGEEYLAERTKPAGLLSGVINKSSQFAITGIIGDIATAAGSDMLTVGRYGNDKGDLGAAIPSFGTFSNIAGVIGGTEGLISSAWDKDKDPRDEAVKLYKAGLKVVPFARSIAVREYLKNLIKE